MLASATVSAIFLVVIGGEMMSVRTAAVIDNSSQHLSAAGKDEEVVHCDDGRVVNCRTLPIFNYTEISPPSTGSDANSDIQQDDNCLSSNLQRHLRCVDTFTRRCLTADQRRAFYSLYSVPTLDMQELCTEGGPYREEYLKHAECLRVAHAKYVQCGNQHQNELANVLVVDHSQHQQNGGDVATTSPFANTEQITQNLVHLCGSFRGHLQCVHGIVRTTCGPQTEAFASQFLSQMASSLLNICDKYGGNAAGGGGFGTKEASLSASSAATTAARRTTGAATAGLIVATTAFLLSEAYARR